MSEAPKLATNRQTQLEVFITRRTVQLGPVSYTTTGCKLLAFELLFLWNALPSCSAQQLQQIIQGTEIEARKNICWSFKY